MARRHLLFPHLPEFLQRYPEIELDVSEGDRYVDLLREGVDAALRVGTLADSDLAARRLTMLREVTVASAKLFAGQGRAGQHRCPAGRPPDGRLSLQRHRPADSAGVPAGRAGALRAAAGAGACRCGCVPRRRAGGPGHHPGSALPDGPARGQLVELLPDAPPTQAR